MAPGLLCLRKQVPGRLGPPPAPRKRGCLRWLDVDRMKGGAGARLDRGEVKARPSGARKSGPSRETPPVERREARVPVARHAGAFTRCPGYPRRSGAPSLGLGPKGKKTTAGSHAPKPGAAEPWLIPP